MIVSLVSLVRPSLLHVQPGHGGVIVPGVASVSLVQVGSPMCRPAAFLTDGTSVMGPAYVLWLSGLPGRWGATSQAPLAALAQLWNPMGNAPASSLHPLLAA